MKNTAVRRSGLTMPVNNPRFVEKAWTRGCDYINLDLEDSVPDSQKAHARTLVKEAIESVSRGGAEVFVRINHDSMEADLEAVVWPGLKRVNYPKTESAEEVRKLEAIITRLEKERGIPEGSTQIRTNIESAVAIVNAYEIATASPRMRDFGAGGAGYDMALNMGIEMFADFDQFVYGNGELELVARALGLQLITPPFVANPAGSVSDPDRAFKEADAARRCGFRHGAGLHPDVVEPQIRGLTPPEDEVEDARWMLKQYGLLRKAGKIWEEVEGRVVDAYEAQRADELLDWAELCAERDRDKSEAVARAKSFGNPT